MLNSQNARFFYTHKRGETYGDIQDSIGVDEQTQRFAISDGVTNSFIPQVLSRILTNAFVSSGIAGFPPLNLHELFTIERGAYLNSLDEDQRFLQEMVEEEFKDAAATFVGVEISDNLIKWIVIGDSCLFILPDNGSLSCYCSNESHADNEDKIHVVFDSHPAQILSNGQTKGKIVQGELEFAPYWIILASDAMSAWIVEAYNNKCNPALLLSEISDNEDFERFVDQEYKEGRLKSDDESVVLVRLNKQQGLNEPEYNDTSPAPCEDTCPGKESCITEEHIVPFSHVDCEEEHSSLSPNEQSEDSNKITLSSEIRESPTIPMSNDNGRVQNDVEQVYAEESITSLPKERHRVFGVFAQLIKSVSQVFSDNSDDKEDS